MSRPFAFPVAASLCAAALSACATAPRPGAASPTAAAPAERVQMEPMTIAAHKDEAGRLTVDAYDAGSLFQDAAADLQADRFAPALAGFDRVVKEFPDSRYVVASLYNAGLSAEGQKDWKTAVDRYRALVDKHGDTKDALDALFRMGACLAEMENWVASAEAFGQLLAHPDLTTYDRIEALARRGLAQHNFKDKVASDRSFREAMTLYRDRKEVENLDADFFVAMSQYYLAESAHDEFRAVPVRLPEKQMKADLEEKARLLLVAQARYVDVARIKHVGWATAAGYQMARLYREFYDSVMEAPAPRMTDEERGIYFEQLKKYLEPLLLKAIHAHELTQMVAMRNGVDNEWVRKSNDELEQLRALVTPSTGAPAPEPPLKAKPARPELEKVAPPALPPREEPGRRGLM